MSAHSGTHAGLRHPLAIAALVTLLVNDLVLKGSGLAPGWLTGKLSDFAWLIVAPVALAALVGARSRRAHATILAGFSMTFSVPAAFQERSSRS